MLSNFSKPGPANKRKTNRKIQIKKKERKTVIYLGHMRQKR